MGQALIPIVVALASAGVAQYNTAKTAKKQDRELAAGIRRQSELQREANARLNKTLTFFEGSKPDQYQEKLSDQFRQQLRLKQAMALAGMEGEGDVSDAFTQAAGKAGAKAIDYGDFLQDVFSRIDAPGEQRREEGYERSGLGTELDIIGRNSRGEDFLTRLAVAGIRRNPWLDILSAGLSGASTGLAIGGGGGFGTKVAAPATFADAGTWIDHDVLNRAQKFGLYG